MKASSEDIGHLVLEVFRLNGRLLAAGDSVVGKLGLTSARWQILGAVMRHDRLHTVSELAREAGVTRQAVQRVTNALVQEGLLSKVENSKDKRAPLLDATALGREIYDKADKARREWLAGVAEGLSVEEVSQSIRLLLRIQRSLELSL
ncbi:MarR family winged helix-turn-helix transcriptional regulator [Limoniibacter endophyticus]|uniref:MarR family transcriptional regulator n=1 Tax=Limoniibacter endophyticus TaxID=1565040 RepID=A0A8J3DGP4_9HYPH|nr:MarR family transcriptional regulator [Limoniibacter endophyticus]GHC65070.1 MarR family transcriptional regulator [Limoniibacter endophyticus]